MENPIPADGSSAAPKPDAPNSGQTPPPVDSGERSARLDIYKAYIGDLGNIGSRYATANGFYLSVVSALLVILAMTETNKALSQFTRLVLVAVPIAGCSICWIWRKTITFYSTLFFAKFEVLREMEKYLPFPTYALELRILNEKRVEWLALNERRVPIFIGILFGVIASAAIVVWIYDGVRSLFHPG